MVYKNNTTTITHLYLWIALKMYESKIFSIVPNYSIASSFQVTVLVPTDTWVTLLFDEDLLLWYHALDFNVSGELNDWI
jgi:hypothetical protein